MKIGDTYRLRGGKWATVIERKEFTFRALVTNDPNPKVCEFSSETLNCLEDREFDAMEMRHEDPYGGV